MARKWLRDFALGALSGAELQRSANELKMDGFDHPEIASLAGLGSDGLHANHVPKQLRSLYLKGVAVPGKYHTRRVKYLHLPHTST